jgi:hypothetical protein
VAFPLPGGRDEALMVEALTARILPGTPDDPGELISDT